MKWNLVNFLNSKSVLTSDQFGFRQGINTFTALSTFSEKIYKTLDHKKSLLSIFIDFQKAFDTVRHDILLKKLHHYGIRGVIHDWFTDYLSNRTQSTKILDHYSSPRKICYGIPQGSVLGRSYSSFTLTTFLMYLKISRPYCLQMTLLYI